MPSIRWDYILCFWKYGKILIVSTSNGINACVEYIYIYIILKQEILPICLYNMKDISFGFGNRVRGQYPRTGSGDRIRAPDPFRIYRLSLGL